MKFKIFTRELCNIKHIFHIYKPEVLMDILGDLKEALYDLFVIFCTFVIGLVIIPLITILSPLWIWVYPYRYSKHFKQWFCDMENLTKYENWSNRWFAKESDTIAVLEERYKLTKQRIGQRCASDKFPEKADHEQHFIDLLDAEYTIQYEKLLKEKAESLDKEQENL